MPAGQSRYSNPIRDEVAKLLSRGSRGQLVVTQLSPAEPLDMLVNVPDLSGVLGIKVQTSSRLSQGRFGEWLVVEFAAPVGQGPDPRFLYFFGHFSLSTMAFAAPVFLVPSTLIHATPHPKSAIQSPRISFKARMDGVNQEWSEYAFAPNDLASAVLSLLDTKPESRVIAA